MALSFSAGHLTLSTWGFSAGDIAVLSGAGRAVGNWIMNQIKDQALLQFLRVDPEDLIPRKGLVDPVALHKRWDVRLTLLQNGKRRVIGGKGGAVIESMGIFSWLMTIIVSGLDASLRVGDMKNVMASFLNALFEEHVDGLDYLQRELPQHIQGWMSAAVVRNIARKARQEWAILLEKELRLPGMMPPEEKDEVERFLIWLSGARNQRENRRFETASSDVYCLALVFQSIGLDLLKAISAEKEELDGDESTLLVVFNPAALSIGQPQKTETVIRERQIRPIRAGMRIPLNFKEECVSLWPGAISENNDRRQKFKEGAEAGRSLKIFPVFPADELHGFGYGLSDDTSALVGRVESSIYRVVSGIFPVVNPALVDAVSRIMAQYPDWRIVEGESAFAYLQTNSACLGKVQVLVLGYYYAILEKVLDTSQMTIQEAYGTWQWSDLHLLYQLNKILADNTRETANSESQHERKVQYIKREGILKLLAMLFAGAEESQWEAVSDRTIGIHGKISIVSSSLLATGHIADYAMRFCLLDIDSSAIPSTARGLVLSGESTFLVRINQVPGDECLQDVSKMNPNKLDQDFTSHIEPDWDNDLQACQVVFRYKGRVIRRLSPLSIERALLSPVRVVQGGPRPDSVPEKVCVASVEHCFLGYPGQNVNGSTYNPNQPPIILPFRGRTKAQVCMRTVYHGINCINIRFLEFWASSSWAEITRAPKDQGHIIILHRPGDKSLEEEAWETSRWVIIM